MSRELPAKPNLEHLREQAKDLLRKLRQTDAGASLKLADAQHTLAREYGFATWPKLKEHVESLTRMLEPGEMLCAAIRASDAGKAAQVLERYPELKAQLNEPLAGYGAGMQVIIAAVQRSDRKSIDVLLHAGADINARSHWWAGGIGVLDECSHEMAGFLIDRGAVLDAHSAARLGILEKLRDLVTADPGVVRARGSNGQTPLHFASSVEIAAYLLDHGAEIDARDVDHESTAAQYMVGIQPRRPEVAIDQQHPPSYFRQADAKIRHRGCLACLGARAGHQDYARADSVHPAEQNRRDRGPICVRHHGLVVAVLHQILVHGGRLANR